MLRAGALLLSAAAGAAALHAHNADDARVVAAAQGQCVAPGTCTPPSTKYSRVLTGPRPGQQWNSDGGFCGAFSVQQTALAQGAWISQDLVRKANRAQPGSHAEHGNTKMGYEVMPNNVAFAAKHLKLTYDEFDYTQPSPQSAAYKKWMKSHLAQGHGVVWFPMCKGDGHDCYGGGPCPNGGHVDHVEPILAIYSDNPLDQVKPYEDDTIMHYSDQDYMPYYRKMSTLQDSTSMSGNCAKAGSGFGRNEMYPCFDSKVTYGLAVTGLETNTSTLPTALSVDTTKEPAVRSGASPSQLHGTVTVSGLVSGSNYTLYRYEGTSSFPAGAPESATDFTASGASWTHKDPHTFASNTAVYYVTIEAGAARYHCDKAARACVPAVAGHATQSSCAAACAA